MARLLISYVVCILMSLVGGCSTTSSKNVTVTVEGVGTSVAEAKKNGFRDAIQLAHGNLVLSDRRVINESLFEDDVSYARGVIETFQILSNKLDPKDRQYHLVMQVTVSETAIQHRLLASQDSARVDGNDITRKIEIGRMQAQSEVNRYMSARRLFEHVSNDFLFSVLDIKTGNLNTVRKGADIFITQDVTVQYNIENLKALCIVAKEYQGTRLQAVPEKFRTNLGVLRIINGTECGAMVNVEAAHLVPMIHAMQDVGICLQLKNQNGQVLRNIFYQGTEIGLINSRNSSNANGYMMSAQFLMQGYGGSSVELVRPIWGVEWRFTLTLPSLPENTLNNLKQVTSSISTDELCTGRQPGRVGVAFKLEDGAFLITNVLTNSPAYSSGLRVGDELTHIDGAAIKGLKVEQVANRLIGAPNTIVRVQIFRRYENRAYGVQLTRYVPRELR